MLLRRSGDTSNKRFDLNAVTGEGEVGVENEVELLAIAEAVFHGDSEALANIRESSLTVLSEQQLVDAFGVASGFNGITKIANATGLPLDQATEEVTVEMRQTTGIDAFADANKSGAYDSA